MAFISQPPAQRLDRLLVLYVAQRGNGALPFIGGQGFENGYERVARLVSSDGTQRNDGDTPVTGIRALQQSDERFCGFDIVSLSKRQRRVTADLLGRVIERGDQVIAAGAVIALNERLDSRASLTHLDS